MEKVRIYQKPTSVTCRAIAKAIFDKGIKYESIDYYVYPFTKDTLKALLQKMNVPASKILRSTDKRYKELDLRNKIYSDDQLIELMVSYPELIESPIIEFGDKAVLARTTKKVDEFFRI
jgi:arsenate reductase (glutaredoxin)